MDDATSSARQNCRVWLSESGWCLAEERLCDRSPGNIPSGPGKNAVLHCSARRCVEKHVTH